MRSLRAACQAAVCHHTLRPSLLTPLLATCFHAQGTILRNDVSGSIMVKCYLSGTPECKFGLNDKLLLDNEAKAKKARATRRP